MLGVDVGHEPMTPETTASGRNLLCAGARIDISSEIREAFEEKFLRYARHSCEHINRHENTWQAGLIN